MATAVEVPYVVLSDFCSERKKKIAIPSPVMGCPWTQHWLCHTIRVLVVDSVHNWARCCTTVVGDMIGQNLNPSTIIYSHLV